jgi:hypothetical protein
MVLACALLLCGCKKSFLDTKQPGVTDINDFFKTDADGTEAIMACYNMLDALNASIWTSMWMAKASLCDEIYTGGQNSGDRPEYQELTTFTFGPTNSVITNIYRYAFMTIYRTNKIVDGFTSPTPYQALVVAEAKTIRAYMYLELVSLYGPVPLTTHELSPSEWQAKSSTIDELYAQIELDLNDAIAALPVKSAMAFIHLLNLDMEQMRWHIANYSESPLNLVRNRYSNLVGLPHAAMIGQMHLAICGTILQELIRAI